jgi:tetratricopeptide (TPR) repeat protein
VWLLAAGRAHDALDVLETLDRDAPRVGTILNLLGLARSAVGDREGALRAFEASVNSHPRREIPLINLARAYRDQGQMDRAKGTLERALGAAPDYADAWVAYGVVLADLRAPNARHVLVRAAQLAPQDATPLAAQGALDLALGQHEQAAESFRQALARDPDHAIARTNLGIALAHLGRNDLALRAFEQATQRSPHVGEAWNGLGSRRLASGNLEGAVGALRQAMTLLPEDPNPAINLGRALEALQQWDAAGRAYHEAIRRHPLHPAAVERLLAITPPEDRDRERRRLGLPVGPQNGRATTASVRASRTLASR